MKTINQKQNIPKGWKETNLGSIADLYQPQTISKTQMSPDGEYLVFGANGIIGKYDRFNHEDSEVIVTCRGASCGSISMTPKQAWITGNAMVIKVDEDKVIKPYIYYFLNNSDLNSVISGGAQPQITRQPISAYKILFPESKTEQQKIAEILGTVDEDIAKTQKVIEATEKLKRGLMQQLFTRGIGHTKFKETKIGEIPEEWGVVKGEYLSEIVTKGASPKWQGFDYQRTGVLFVTSENVRDGLLDISSPKFLPIEFHEKLKNSQLKNGDILINIVGASIGRSCLYESTFQFANINQAVCMLRPNSKIFSKFILQYLQYSKTISRLLNSQNGSARLNLSLGDIREFLFVLPRMPEQEKIAEILSDVDEKIWVNKKLKAKLTLLKKGLMQDLLSGRVRVNNS